MCMIASMSVVISIGGVKKGVWRSLDIELNEMIDYFS